LRINDFGDDFDGAEPAAPLASGPLGKWMHFHTARAGNAVVAEIDKIASTGGRRNSTWSRRSLPGFRVIKAPHGRRRHAPNAERWVGTMRREWLDRILVFGQRHLHHVLATYVSWRRTGTRLDETLCSLG
jgi:hypothetical protein